MSIYIVKAYKTAPKDLRPAYLRPPVYEKANSPEQPEHSRRPSLYRDSSFRSQLPSPALWSLEMRHWKLARRAFTNLRLASSGYHNLVQKGLVVVSWHIHDIQTESRHMLGRNGRKVEHERRTTFATNVSGKCPKQEKKI